MGPMGGPPPMGPPPGGGNKNPALVIVLIVLVVGAVIGGAILLTSGDDDKDEPTAGTTVPGQPGGEGGGDVTVPDITLPDGSDITLPDGSDITLPDIPDGGTGLAEDGPPTAPPSSDDSVMTGLANDCYNGDMQACDDLFMQSPADSELEDYGDTCGHRFPTSQGFCATALPDPQPPS
jgi:hypothetical protein